MDYETDPGVLRNLSDEDWTALLKATWNAPAPRRLVIIQENERLMLILKRLSEGALKGVIARELGISPGLVSKILKGERR